jgi:hypothetical protein
LFSAVFVGFNKMMYQVELRAVHTILKASSVAELRKILKD